mgnify:CR=1 FL=1
MRLHARHLASVFAVSSLLVASHATPQQPAKRDFEKEILTALKDYEIEADEEYEEIDEDIDIDDWD